MKGCDMSEKKNPVVHLVAWLVAHDRDERARLIERAEEAGDEWPGWRQFAVRFAARYPYSAAFLPVAVALYFISFYQILGG